MLRTRARAISGSATRATRARAHSSRTPLTATLVRRAKNRSPISGDSTKKRKKSQLVRTETWTTPRGYCSVMNPGVPWCHKGFRDLSKPRITLRVGKLTIGDGS
ncbi:hypothetical protein GCM10015535_31010 [Streptomyces gelaticus]|uniref:Uncharacterized protein n=1 Tax=Streptomyces gelaticus TaxID=285446 RepID=A0ABQ2VYC3_9ACTN|nr:hypothetical protein GCM10015535_31010 [Streptomyces gelaticus]